MLAAASPEVSQIQDEEKENTEAAWSTSAEANGDRTTKAETMD